MRVCSYACEVGLDNATLEDHRNRASSQISMNVRPGVAECVVAANRIAYLDCQGAADVERGTKMSPTTLFRCFSMTKPITAVAVMRLVDEAKLHLDDPVAKYIPSFKRTQVVRRDAVKLYHLGPEHLEPQARPLTVRMLLMHTSGLSYGPDRMTKTEPFKPETPDEQSYLQLQRAIDDGHIGDLAEFCNALAALPLRFQPGTRFLYSLGMDVAGRVAEVVSGMPLDVYLQRAVLTPCGMVKTTWYISHDRADDLAALYKANLKELKAKGNGQNAGESTEPRFKIKLARYDGTSAEESAWFGRPRILAGGGQMGTCAGGLLTCLQDMALFCNMLINGGETFSGCRVLKQPTVRSMWRDWLQLKSTASIPEGKIIVPGWDEGKKLGWNPLGHFRHSDKAIFMGGWTTSWSVYPRWKVATVSLHQTCAWFDVPNSNPRRDELDSVVEVAHRRFERGGDRKSVV